MATLSFQQAYEAVTEHFNAGRFREAEALLMSILGKVKDHPQCLHLLGLSQHQLGRGTAGVELIRRAIDKAPNNAEFHANLAAVLGSFGQDDAALKAAERAIELDPNLPDAHNNRGTILRTLRRRHEAMDEFAKALKLRPDFPEAIHNLATSLLDNNQPEEAIVYLQRVAALRPNNPETYNSLGNALLMLNRFQESINSYRKALSLRPQHVDAMTNLGHAMRAQNRLQEAMQTYQQALTINPQASEPRWAAGTILLLQGDYIGGFEMLESRLFHRDKLASFAQPNWNGEDLQGKRIMLVAEQGIGDTIQFVRYAPLIKARGALVAVLCQREVERLLKSCQGIDLVVPDGSATPTVDFRCPMMSAARVLKTTLQTIPNQVPYLAADLQLSASWRDRLNRESSGLRVGVRWAGDPRHKNDANRSMPAGMLAALSKVPNVRLYSLQKGVDRVEGITDWTADLSDMADTAALVSNLDLVITVDTAICHLAGALAKPVWTLVPFAPDWRWLLDRTDSPWYPTMRLFRQPTVGDWGTPMSQVTAELTRLAVRTV